MDIVQQYDLAVAWNWEYDHDFFDCVFDAAQIKKRSVLEIQSENVEEVFRLLKEQKISFRYILDRASDEDELFQPMAKYILNQFRSGEHRSPCPINPYDLQIHAADKATMHLEFLANNIVVPYTIIVSPYNHRTEIELSLSELKKLDRPFIIKPANTTGGGIGVVVGAETLKEVIEARQYHKNDKYLLQETITPTILAGRRAWFRVFYAFGTIIPSWWDDITHIYSLLNEEEELQLGLG
jgi:glutathione synthase/RimK-type ligase-like ATP-grasp enzyme